MKRKEEESLLSLAENKLNVHQELEAKESQIKNLESKIVELVKEIKRLRNSKLFTLHVFLSSKKQVLFVFQFYS